MAIFVHSKEDFLENHLEIKWPSFKVKHGFNMLGFHVATFFHNFVAEFKRFLVTFCRDIHEWEEKMQQNRMNLESARQSGKWFVF